MPMDAAANENQVRRVRVATVMHYRHAVQGVRAMSILGLPDVNAAWLRARVHHELRSLLTSALMEQLLLSVSRMHDAKPDLDGIPSILSLLRVEAVRKVVVVSGCDHYLDEANRRWAP